MSIPLSDVLWIIAAVVISIIAIRISFSFDINKYLESGKKDIENQIKNHCPHAFFKELDGGTAIQSSFVSPSGTVAYACQKCGLWVHCLDAEDEHRRLRFFMENPKEYIKQEKKFQKLLKKGGFV